jgi:hypothetical protein
MKHTALLALVLTGLALAPRAALADRSDRVALGVGSFAAGVIVGSNLEHRHAPRHLPSHVVACPPPRHVSYGYSRPFLPPPPPFRRSSGLTIHIGRAPAICPPPVVACPPEPSGYWREERVRSYVPERWILVAGPCGTTRRVLEPGYYTYSTRRVWVDTTPAYATDAYDSGYTVVRNERW